MESLPASEQRLSQSQTADGVVVGIGFMAQAAGEEGREGEREREMEGGRERERESARECVCVCVCVCIHM